MKTLFSVGTCFTWNVILPVATNSVCKHCVGIWAKQCTFSDNFPTCAISLTKNILTQRHSLTLKNGTHSPCLNLLEHTSDSTCIAHSGMISCGLWTGALHFTVTPAILSSLCYGDATNVDWWHHHGPQPTCCWCLPKTLQLLPKVSALELMLFLLGPRVLVLSDVNLVTSTVSSPLPTLSFWVGLEKNLNDRDHAVSRIALLLNLGSFSPAWACVLWLFVLEDEISTKTFSR